MAAEILEIEDVSDCTTCTRRESNLSLEYLAAVRLKSVGSAWCPECGRPFHAMVERDYAQDDQ